MTSELTIIRCTKTYYNLSGLSETCKHEFGEMTSTHETQSLSAIVRPSEKNCLRNFPFFQKYFLTFVKYSLIIQSKIGSLFI